MPDAPHGAKAIAAYPFIWIDPASGVPFGVVLVAGFNPAPLDPDSV
ncbi:MAG TPA: hypothetical protein VMN36_14275 [Verrucomicrobiales bacterium]|nr:hypothetical protein [Verrucomicrobiales bacterium]